MSKTESTQPKRDIEAESFSVDDDNDSTSTGTGGTPFSGDGASTEGEKDIRDGMIRNEDRAVYGIRIVVAVFVLVCAVAVGVSIYFFATSADTRTFELNVGQFWRRFSYVRPQFVFLANVLFSLLPT